MSFESLSVCVPWVPFHSSVAMIFDDILQFGLDLQWIPWELTYPLPRHFWRWCSFFPRWDMLYISLEGSRQFVASGNVTVPLEVKVQVRGIRNRRQVSISTYNVTMVSIHNGLLMVIWRLFFWHVGPRRIQHQMQHFAQTCGNGMKWEERSFVIARYLSESTSSYNILIPWLFGSFALLQRIASQSFRTHEGIVQHND